MTKTKEMLLPEFKKYMSDYFPVVTYNNIPVAVQEAFEIESKKFNLPSYYVPGAALNIIEVQMDSFLKVAKLKPRFLTENRLEDFQWFFIEHPKPYFQGWINGKDDFAHIEMLFDLYVYNKNQEKVIGFLEMRLGVATFQQYFQDAFIGMIRTEEEFKHQQIATLMMRLSATYLFYRTRKKLYSGTLLSPEMQCCLQKMNNTYQWTEYAPHHNEITQEERSRYLIHPVKFNIDVKDDGVVLPF